MGHNVDEIGCTCDTPTGSENRRCGFCKAESNSRVDKQTRRKWLRCPICPPNKGENSKRRAKHGSKKPKYKDKRK